MDRKNYDHFGVATLGECGCSNENGNTFSSSQNNNIRLFYRCTDGIVFVVDSVDVERMEEAKMELMRTAKCSENHVCNGIS